MGAEEIRKFWKMNKGQTKKGGQKMTFRFLVSATWQLPDQGF